MRDAGMLRTLDCADQELCATLEGARKLAAGTYQDCFESSEIEAHRLVADLLELRGHLLTIRRTYFEEGK